ncbi:glycosyltransferase family 2 protein [Pelagibacteraceae bacterium]|mgnify:CR=1 FL=1|nr:glycosyltransferase family 2 protein [Pelagibacteraceae bacterium]
MDKKKLISIVTPTFNEEENIEKLCIAVSNVFENSKYDYEHIIIDNNSNDSTIEILRKLSANDKKIKVIINTRNFGHIKSPIYGLLQSRGDASILLAADFQDPVELIDNYISEWESGYDVVLAQKTESEENFFSHFTKKIFYNFIRSISEVSLMTNTTGSGLFDKKIIDSIKKVDDPYPYFRGLLSEITSNIKLVKFKQPKRKHGKTKNNLYTLYDLGILGVVKHSKVPLRLITFVGFVSSFTSMLIAIVFLFRKLFNWSSFDAGVAPLIIGLFFIASIQIFLLGFIGEYVMNILIQTRKLPLVIEKERINF